MEKQKLSPCLWFNDNAESAVAFYTSIFERSKIKGVTRYGAAAARASGRQEGSVMTVLFELAGHEFMALNGGPHFKFTPAVSFFVACDSEREIDGLWAKLSEGGKARIGLDKYPFAAKYGWCEDKFGLSWQMILSSRRQKISPALLFTKEQSRKAEEAMKFYTALFDGSKIESIARDDKTGVILHARFSLTGQDFVAMESPIEQPYTFNPAISFTVKCKDQPELDKIWNTLSAYKEAEQCGWLKDKFGVSWQIVPAAFGEMMLQLDARKSERVMQALLQMKKLDIQALTQAAQS
ncbi:MAG: VOC family protein [SAR324 cluster bacterium]